MTSVCYLIVCVNLLSTFVQVESFLSYQTRNISRRWKNETRLMLDSITVENQDEYLAKTITPYWNMSYDEQLDLKQSRSKIILRAIVKRSMRLYNLKTFKLFRIIPSPVITAYRNKDEFHIIPGVDGNPKTVGCIFGSLKLGKIFSIRPTKIVTIRESHKRVAQVYEDFIRLSPIGASSIYHRGGHWKTLVVRSNELGDVMAAVTVNPIGYGFKMILNQKRKLKKYFIKHLPNITLYHQVCSKKSCTDTESRFTLMYGRDYISEKLKGCKFKIFPDSIFPKNRKSAERMIDTIINATTMTRKTTVLDIYSSTGTTSIILSKIVKNIFAFEAYPQAVTEGNLFALFNNINNLNFLLGNVNYYLDTILESLNSSIDVVAILNHRRGGVELDVIKSIRSTYQISTIVYIIYKPNSGFVTENFINLCSSNYSKVPPFKMTKVFPFDLLPQTAYIELIAIFQRYKVSSF